LPKIAHPPRFELYLLLTLLPATIFTTQAAHKESAWVENVSFVCTSVACLLLAFCAGWVLTYMLYIKRTVHFAAVKGSTLPATTSQATSAPNEEVDNCQSVDGSAYLPQRLSSGVHIQASRVCRIVDAGKTDNASVPAAVAEVRPLSLSTSLQLRPSAVLRASIRTHMNQMLHILSM
jgi:hypothetical protein